MRAHPVPDSAEPDSTIVARALLRTADRLNVTNRVVAKIIGVSEATVSRMRRGEYPLLPDQKPFQLAVLFIRLYRSLDAILGGDDFAARSWLTKQNEALNGIPLELIQSVSGLVHVIQYLDARRAVV